MKGGEDEGEREVQTVRKNPIRREALNYTATVRRINEKGREREKI